MKTYFLNAEQAYSVAINCRWFADYRFRASLLKDGRYRVVTNYPVIVTPENKMRPATNIMEEC